MTEQKEFTPALGHSALTPLYDFAIALLTRENIWRTDLLRELSPSENDRILDVGCGTGSLAIRIKALNETCEVHGIDPDHDVLTMAQDKATSAGADITFHKGFLRPNMRDELGSFTKIVSSLVFHQTALEVKREILESMITLLRPGGQLFIADYGLQRTGLMRTLFRCTVQALDGVEDTQHNAKGCMPELIAESGFSDVTELQVIPTPTGSISLYSAIWGAEA